jgi:hypothetical protein
MPCLTGYCASATPAASDAPTMRSGKVRLLHDFLRSVIRWRTKKARFGRHAARLGPDVTPPRWADFPIQARITGQPVNALRPCSTLLPGALTACPHRWACVILPQSRPRNGAITTDGRLPISA